MDDENVSDEVTESSSDELPNEPISPKLGVIDELSPAQPRISFSGVVMDERQLTSLDSCPLRRGSMADSRRPDYFESLLKDRLESARILSEVIGEDDLSIDDDDDDDDDDDMKEDDLSVDSDSQDSQEERDIVGDGSLINTDGAKIHSPRQHAKLIRQLTERFNEVNGGENRSDEIHVHVRLKDVSYHVPVYTDEPAMASVWNQTQCYVFWQLIKRLFRYCCRRGARDYFQIMRPVEKKAILRNANLIFKPGNSYIVLGPPGCGKTTLLRVIGGVAHQEYTILTGNPIKNKSHISGQITYNGLSPVGPFKTDEMCLENVVSYVEQLDYHEPLLTVRETFEFARQCRCGVDTNVIGTSGGGGTTTTAETGELLGNNKNNKMSENMTIDGLGLSHVADTYVGNAAVRGVSGGQRRRVTVGEMMQGQNPVACADEISTGLDSASTYDMIRSIVFFARAAGTTRIVSLLQPGPETFALFDETVILSKGLVIYAGPISKVIEYFEDLGYTKPITEDVADFLQGVSTPDGAKMMDPLIRPDGHLTSEEFAQHWNDSFFGNCINEELESDLPTKWTVSDSPQGDAENPTAESTPLPERMKIRYQNSGYASMKLIYNRFFTIWKRNRVFIITKLIENVRIGASLGALLARAATVKFKCDPNDPTMFLDADAPMQIKILMDAVYGGFFVFCWPILQGNTAAVPDAVAARRVHYKHKGANFYQDVSFIIGRLLATWPMRLIETLCFGIPFYFIIGLDPSFVSFVLYMAMTLLYMIFANILFQLIAMSAPGPQTGQRVAILIVLLMCLFGGFIVYPDSLGFAYKWVHYINPIAWVYKCFLTIEFTSSKYDDTATCFDPDKFLTDRGFSSNRDMISWSFLIISLYTVAATIALALISRYLSFQEIDNKKILEEENNNEEQRLEMDDVPFTKINLTFENMCYDVKASTGDDTLRLLDNVSGAMMAGRMCALMGSSGAGKTTLMDVISLRKTSGEITGTVELNGFAQEKTSFLRSSGYVEQFDVQTSQLTVHETVAFSARLKLDSRNEATKDDASKLRFVDSVLKMLELTPLKNLQVGCLELRTGLSFEQRKRLAIAVELAGSPSILFLDEPTSGLDSRGALVVMRAMKKIADTGRTICATIHQPSSAVFAMFDDLLLLKKGGTVVFFGDLGEHSIHLTNYFETAGCEPINYGQNPASWMLLASEFREPAEWADLYKSSNQYRNLMEQIHAERESIDEAKKISYDDKYATTLKGRLAFMSYRVNTIYRRSPAYNTGRIVILVTYALLLALVFMGKENMHLTSGDPYTENDMDGLFGTIFFSFIIVGLTMILMVIPEVKKIRDVFYKHKASGMMSHHAVVFALATGEMPYVALISILYTLVFFFLVGLSHSPLKFFQFWGFFMLNLAIYTYFGQLFTCLVPDAPTAKNIAGSVIGLNIFGTGFLIKPMGSNPANLVTFFISPAHYCYEGLIMSQFKGLTQKVIPVVGSAYFNDLDCTIENKEDCFGTMEDYASFAFGARFSPDHLLMDVLIPISYIIVAMLGTHWALGHLNYGNT